MKLTAEYLRAIIDEVLNEEITVDGKKISPKAEKWLKKKLSSNPRVAKAFGLDKKAPSQTNQAPFQITQKPNKVEKAALDAAQSIEKLKKITNNSSAVQALEDQWKKEKEEAEELRKKAQQEQDKKLAAAAEVGLKIAEQEKGMNNVLEKFQEYSAAGDMNMMQDLYAMYQQMAQEVQELYKKQESLLSK
jgi:uncharacterized protein YkvS